MIKGIIFDIDDTLYLERDYVKSGFKAVGQYIYDRTLMDQYELFDYLWQSFLKGVRTYAFDRLIEAYPSLACQFEALDLVAAYRNHQPEISLLPEARNILFTLHEMGYRLGVISDGFLASQQAKVQALGIENLVDTIHLTDKWGRQFWKPNPRAFEACAEDLELSHAELCYVADNLEKDFIAPNQLGWLTIQLMIPGQQYVSANPAALDKTPQYCIDNYPELLKVIEAQNQIR